MKTIKKIYRQILVFALLMSSLQCSNESDDPNPIRSIQETEAINALFSAIPDWEIIVLEPEEDVFIENVDVIDENTDESYSCDVFERNLVEVIDDFVSVETNEGVIWPGAMIQGKSLETGDLKLITANQKRAPITLTTDLTLDKTSVTIDPNSVNARQAIADFMIAAGKMPEGSQSAGNMYFRVEEAINFEQSMRQMGVSAGFTEPQYNAGLEGSLSVEKNRSSKTHTVVAKFLQEMFTVRVADDLIPTPADFFTSDFSSADLENMQNTGEIGEDNIPIYIESVTYGRILLFSSTSENVASANDLALALEGSMADYAKIDGEYNGEHQEIMSSARHKIFSAGGTDKAANEVIGNLDWSKFFVESPASTAVPISFKARTVNGKQIVGLVYNTNVVLRDDCTLNIPPNPNTFNYQVTVEWTNTKNTGLCFGSGFGSCSPNAYVKTGTEVGFVPLTAVNGYKREFIVQSGDDFKDFTIRSFTRLKLGWPYTGFTTKTTQSTFNPTIIPEVENVTHTLSNIAGSVTFTYVITTAKIN